MKKKTWRAGKRKCNRCKELWYSCKGEQKTLCHRCREHCSRCDVLLEDNQWPSQVNKSFGVCAACSIEMHKIRRHGTTVRDNHLVRKFGITLVEYDAILKAQDGGCWICRKVPSEGQYRLAVDHLHSKGEKKRNPREIRGRVRGLLCWQCNSALGNFRDDITKLRKAAEYLEVWPAQSVLKEKSNG